MIDIVSSLNDFLNAICAGFSKSDSTAFIAVSFIASLVTIGGFLSLIIYYIKRRISKECQKKIILDMIRHLFINCAIVESIRISIRKEDFKIRPNNGVFSKFAFLQSDTELSRFSVNAKNFEILHKVSLFVRNYNIIAEVAERHFEDSNIPNDIKEEELNDLFYRAVVAIECLRDLSKRLNLGISETVIIEFLKEQTSSESGFGRWPINYTREDIPKRTIDSFKEYPYFDSIGLTDEFNDCIIFRGHWILYLNVEPNSKSKSNVSTDNIQTDTEVNPAILGNSVQNKTEQ